MCMYLCTNLNLLKPPRLPPTPSTDAQVINQVGAVNLHAELDCEAFASTHSASSHYDRASFVGLAWRPPSESICCEVYSTGRANLPGSVRERDLLRSFSRMLSELLAHSSKPELCNLIEEDLRLAHRQKNVVRDDAPIPTDFDDWLIMDPLIACTTTIEDENLLEMSGF